MRLDLNPHPDSPPNAVQFVGVTIQRERRGLHLSYIVEGDASRLVIPPPARPCRTDELWRSTCFELFIGGEGQGYCEFNLSPSGQWAAYRFPAYRGEAEALGLDEPPRIRFSREPFGLLLSSFIAVELTGSPRVGLSAVIEETDGAKSYWALAHPPGPPDFHHEACFALQLPASP